MSTERDQAEQIFVNNLKTDEIYSSRFLSELLEKHNINPENVNITSFTYNRWNIGMTDLRCLFEFIARGEYKYLGPNFKYNGFASHFPHGENSEYIVAKWIEGEINFLDSRIKIFSEWRKTKYQGERVISIGTHFTFNREKTSIKAYLANERVEGRITHNPIKIESKLGKVFCGKRLNEEFEFNNTNFKIISIDD